MAARVPRRSDRLMGVQLRRLPGHARPEHATCGGRHGDRRRCTAGATATRLAAPVTAQRTRASSPAIVRRGDAFTHLHFDHVGWSSRRASNRRVQRQALSITTTCSSTGPTTSVPTRTRRPAADARTSARSRRRQRLAPLADTIVLHRAQRTRDRPRRDATAGAGSIPPATASSRSHRAANGRYCSPTPRTIPRSSRPTTGTRSPTSTPKLAQRTRARTGGRARRHRNADHDDPRSPATASGGSTPPAACAAGPTRRASSSRRRRSCSCR